MKFGEKKYTEDHFLRRLLGSTLGSIALFLLEVLQIGLIAGVIIFSVRTFLVKPFIVQGGSMEPNYHDNEYLIINQTKHVFKRGDAIVFTPPTDIDDFYIKRVIGLPGETIELKDGQLTVFNDTHPNGFALHESYINEFTHGRERVTIGLDEYYVLGDNRDSSVDSRNFGTVPAENIVGRVWVRGLPLDKAGIIQRPIYSY